MIRCSAFAEHKQIKHPVQWLQARTIFIPAQDQFSDSFTSHHTSHHIYLFYFKGPLDKLLRDGEYVINGPFNAASLIQILQHFRPKIECTQTQEAYTQL